MFARIHALFGKKSARRMGMIAGSLAVMGMVAPLALAEADGWRRGRDDRHVERRDGGHDNARIIIRPEFVIGGYRPSVVVETRRARMEVAPSDVRFTAFQSEDRVIIVANGTNRGDGFTTSIAACDLGGLSPMLDLFNFAPSERRGNAETCFSITTSIHSHRVLCDVTVKVAGRTYTVPVVQASSLS